MRHGTLIGPIIIAIGLVISAIAFAVVGALLETADGSAELRLNRNEAELATQRSDIETLRAEIRDAQVEIERLSEDLALQASQPRMAAPAPMPEMSAATLGTIGDEEVGDHAGTAEMTEVMQLAKTRFNQGVTQPGNRVMMEVLGPPRDSYGTDCQSVTQPRLKSLLETRQIGPIRVTMIKPALDSLERILAELQQNEPDIYNALGTAGAMCARLIRGSRTAVSNHSWGTAIDLKLEDKLDGFGDGGTQFGLLLLAELFNKEGWYWGATYSREDSMHFEVGVETLRKWQAEGRI